jgi:hypothetical protein
MVPVDEAALSEIPAAIAKGSTGLLPNLRQQIGPAVLAELSAAVAAGKPNTENLGLREATVT